MGYYDGTEKIDVPALHMSSWYDPSVDETIFEFNYFRENAVSETAANNQFLIVPPTTHCSYERATEHTKVGERDVGDARRDYYSIYLDWFDYWLKGKDNAITDMPKVQYYTMGSNQWQSASVRGLGAHERRRRFLQSGGSHGQPVALQRLSIRAHPADRSKDRRSKDYSR